VITGNIKSQVDQIWNAFWSGGVSDPLGITWKDTRLTVEKEDGKIFLSNS
jgi:type I restriction enzyme M protein